MTQRGFILPALPVMAWAAIGASVVILALGVAVKVQTSRLEAVRQEFATFQAQTKALGDIAAAKAKSEIDRQARLLKETEATSEKAKSDLAATLKRLRDARNSRGNILPTVTSTAVIPDAARSGPDLLRALRRFDDAVTGDLSAAREGIAAIVEPADENTVRLKLSVDWAAAALRQ